MMLSLVPTPSLLTVQNPQFSKNTIFVGKDVDKFRLIWQSRMDDWSTTVH